ncbi:MAG: hypothetical protein J07HB67_00339 [halophilic archaeon J07HB67]|jgi:hypothetical protein|nr:MAG: hypothetical protein J07HB67_00339 [halophilic archaeon J07HB67]
MKQFSIDGEGYCRSLAFDASRKDGRMVTVGVEATRKQEAELLDTCCQEQESNYTPFNKKYDPTESERVPVGSLISSFPGKVAIALQRDPPNALTKTEAADSAVLYSKLQVDSTAVVIADGGERHAELLGRVLKSRDEHYHQ